MNDTMKNNSPATPVNWFLQLDRMELDQVIAQLVGPRHAELRLLVDEVASTFNEVDSAECLGDVNWGILCETWYEFIERLGQHLSAENRTLLLYATGESGPPTQEDIRHIRNEHERLLEDLDALIQFLENLQNANFCDEASSAKLAHAADRFADLESALNAEIFAEEVGILRRCAAIRQNS